MLRHHTPTICTMVSRFEQLSSPRILLLVAMGFLTVQGAVLLGVRFLTADGADVVHPSVHFVTGLIGLGSYRRLPFLFKYGVAFGLGYLLLGVLGAVGLADPPWFPLGIVDHVFHVAFGVTVFLISATGLRSVFDSPSPGTS